MTIAKVLLAGMFALVGGVLVEQAKVKPDINRHAHLIATNPTPAPTASLGPQAVAVAFAMHR